MNTSANDRTGPGIKGTLPYEDRMDGGYRQPHVHDLGKLEQVQGGLIGTYIDAFGRFYVFPG